VYLDFKPVDADSEVLKHISSARVESNTDHICKTSRGGESLEADVCLPSSI